MVLILMYLHVTWVLTQTKLINGMRKIQIVIFIIACAQVFSACKYQEVIVGKPSGLHVEKMDMNSIDLLIDMPVNNPNNFSFSLRKLSLDIYIGDIKLGNVSKVERVKIAARSNEIYPITLTVVPAELLGNSFKIVSALSKRNVELGVKGKIKLSKFIIAKNIKVDLQEKVKIY